MSIQVTTSSGSVLRQRMLEDMTVRGFTEATRRDYIRFVRSFASFLCRPPDSATAEDLRRFQVHQTEIGMQPPSINGSVSALRFFFTVTLDRPDLSRRLALVRQPRKLPTVLSPEEPAHHWRQRRNRPASETLHHPRRSEDKLLCLKAAVRPR